MVLWLKPASFLPTLPEKAFQDHDAVKRWSLLQSPRVPPSTPSFRLRSWVRLPRPPPCCPGRLGGSKPLLPRVWSNPGLDLRGPPWQAARHARSQADHSPCAQFFQQRVHPWRADGGDGPRARGRGGARSSFQTRLNDDDREEGGQACPALCGASHRPTDEGHFLSGRGGMVDRTQLAALALLARLDGSLPPRHRCSCARCPRRRSSWETALPGRPSGPRGAAWRPRGDDEARLRDRAHWAPCAGS